jgi:hypothetical protein
MKQSRNLFIKPNFFLLIPEFQHYLTDIRTENINLAHINRYEPCKKNYIFLIMS